MKNHFKLLLVFISLLFNVTSCQQIDKKIAKDNLHGIYYGTMRFDFKASHLNIGLEDFSSQEKCMVQVFSTPNSPSMVYTLLKPNGESYSPVNINISGFQLKSNGSLFNIPSQLLKDSGNEYLVEGVSMFVDNDGMKADGAVDEQSNLQFSYSGNFPIPVQGNIVKIPCIVTCIAKMDKSN